MSSLVSRRELLAAMLGAPVALAAGCSSSALPPAGGIVGASHEVGHRLREDRPARPADSAWRDVDVVIVGGGVAGLAAGWKLRRAGIDDFVVLELEPELGGTSRGGESKVSRFPWGAHYLPAPMKENVALISLLDELGVLAGIDDHGEPVVAEQYLCRDPEERVFAQGRWHEGLFPKELATAVDELQLAKFRAVVDEWVTRRDGRGRRAFAIPTMNSSDDADVLALDKITMADWLNENRFTSPRLRWLVDYACRDDYGLTADHASAWAGLFYFASRQTRAGDEPRPLMTWPEGNSRLVRHLAERVGARALRDRLVASVVPAADGGRVELVALPVDAATTVDTVGYRARRVIFAAPQFVASHVVEGHREARPGASQFDYGAWMVANLHLSARPRNVGFAPCWDNVLVDSPALGYVVATHQAGVDVGPTVFTYYFPLSDADGRESRTRLLDLGWSHWADVCLTDLSTAHPDLRRLTTRLDVMRWGHAMIRPKPGFIASEARRRAAEPFGGVHFAHSDLSGVALFEEAFAQGCRAAEEVVTALKGRG